MAKMIPSDPHILLSFMNMKLRDSGATLAETCAELDADEEAVCAALARAGYVYSKEQNAFLAEDAQ